MKTSSYMWLGLGAAIICSLITTPASAVLVTNDIDVTPNLAWSFESYANGAQIALSNGSPVTVVDGVTNSFFGPVDSLVASNLPYAEAPAGDYPIQAATHTNVAILSADGAAVTNLITGGNLERVWLEHLIMPTFWDGDANPTVPADAQMAYFFNTNGNLVVYHGLINLAGADPDTFDTNVFTEVDLGASQVSPSNWVRTSIEMIYDGDYVASYFRIYLDGVKIASSNAYEQPYFDGEGTPAYVYTNSGSYFAMSQPGAVPPSKINAIILTGTAKLDDFVVTTNTPTLPESTDLTITPTVVGGVGHGSIDPGTAQSVPNGSNITFVVTASNNWFITNVEVVVEGTSTNEYGPYSEGQKFTNEFVNVTTNGTIKAWFDTDLSYTVTAAVVSGQGTINPTGDQTVHYGNDQAFTVSPSNGWFISNVEIVENGATNNVGPYAVNADYPYTFSGVTQNGSISATFLQQTYAVTGIVASGEGDVSPLGAQTVNYGNDEPFTVTPSNGWYISDVEIIEDGVTANEGPLAVNQTFNYTFSNVTQNGSISATFLQQTYAVTSIVVSGQGTIDPLGGQTVNYGDDQAFTVSPSNGWFISNVEIVENGATNNVGPYAVNADYPYTFSNVTQNGSISANFVVSSNPVVATVTQGSGAVAPAGTTYVTFANDLDVVVTPAAGWFISGIEVVENGGTNYPSLAGLGVGDNYTNTFAAVSNAAALNASFTVSSNTVTSSVMGGQGTIDPLGAQSLEYGSNVTFDVTASNYWYISQVEIVENGGTNTLGDQGTSYSYEYTNVTDTGTFKAWFALQTTNGVPVWWLAQHGLSDPDGNPDSDPFTSGEEWLSSTDPTNEASFFVITDSYQADGSNFFEWVCSGVDTSLPPIGVFRSMNLTNGFSNVASVARSEGTNVWGELAPSNQVFYQITATNAP